MSVVIEFDENDDGVISAGEDMLWGVRNPNLMEVDDMLSVAPCDPPMFPCATTDWQTGGTNDIADAFSLDPVWTMEFSHPLMSQDATRDIQVTAGDALKLAVYVEIGWVHVPVRVRVPTNGFLTMHTLLVP